MKLTVASYNIQHGKLSDYDMKKLMASVVACGADIVGIQEVDIGVTRSAQRDIASLMAAELGFYVQFAKAIDFQGGAYGTAILSRYPIIAFSCIPLESGKYEKRSIGIATIEVDGESVCVMNTHISYENVGQRRIQLDQIRDLLPQGTPWIMTGDFNTGNFEELRALGQVSLVNCESHRYGTFRETGSPIDNIIYTEPWSVLSSGMIDNDHSDHNLLYADMIK